jgi:hypothetical protein
MGGEIEEMVPLLEEHRVVMRRRRLLENGLCFGSGGKMTTDARSEIAKDLLQICAAAGAVVSTTIASDGEVVVFYKDGDGQGDSYDELHIRSQKNACILIAVFV